MAVIAGVGAAARQGLLVRDAQALERLGATTTVIFDKTGTLTFGKPAVRNVHAEPGVHADDMLAAAAAIEQFSAHPIANAIVQTAGERGLPLPLGHAVVALPGGLTGTVRSRPYAIGNAEFLKQRTIDVPPESPVELSRVYVASDGLVLGWIDIGDEVRPQSGPAISRLRSRGIDVSIVSGDAREPTRRLAQELGIGNWHARALPEQKADLVKRARDHGRHVAFVGDGINDAPALAAADVGIAMGAGADVALETAPVAIISNDPTALAEGIDLSRATLRKIKQNLFWACAYNVVLIPLAAAGMVHPIFAAAAMATSSLFVVCNSLLLSGRQRSASRLHG